MLILFEGRSKMISRKLFLAARDNSMAFSSSLSGSQKLKALQSQLDSRRLLCFGKR